MLGFIKGTLVRKEESSAVVEVLGLGFDISTPLSTHCNLPEEGQKCKLWTVLYPSDKGLSLYGFSTPQEKELFLLLLKTPHLGPKKALAVVSHFTLGDLGQALEDQDTEKFKKVPGIGKKMAERLMVELKDKIPQMTGLTARPQITVPWESTLISALANLGYTRGEVKMAMDRAALEPQMEEEEMIRRCLKVLGGHIG